MIKLILTDLGDSSVGMFPVYEEILVSFEYGGHDAESIRVFTDALKELVGDCFGYGDGKTKVSISTE